MITLALIGGIFVAFEVGQIVGWRLDYGPGEPFNWRVFLGPWVYRKWWIEHR